MYVVEEGKVDSSSEKKIMFSAKTSRHQPNGRSFMTLLPNAGRKHGPTFQDSWTQMP